MQHPGRQLLVEDSMAHTQEPEASRDQQETEEESPQMYAHIKTALVVIPPHAHTQTYGVCRLVSACVLKVE